MTQLRKRLDRLEKEKAKADDPLRSTKVVLDHHLAAFDSGDMDAILADYAKDAVLLTSEGIFKGHAQIRPVLQKLLDDIFSTATEFKMIQKIVRGDIAFIVWSAKSQKVSVSLGTDTYVVRFGKIVGQTFAADTRQSQ